MILKGMEFLVEMDRTVEKGQYYISPGGFECGGKQFDFFQHEGYTQDNPRQILFIMKGFDDSLGKEEHVIVTPEDVKLGFTEFYIHTGEYDDPEINVKEVKKATFFFRDKETGEETALDASDKLLESINACLNGKYGYYYLSSSSYTDEDNNVVEQEATIGIYYRDEPAINISSEGEFYDDEQGSLSGVEYFNTAEELKNRLREFGNFEPNYIYGFAEGGAL